MSVMDAALDPTDPADPVPGSPAHGSNAPGKEPDPATERMIERELRRLRARRFADFGERAVAGSIDLLLAAILTAPPLALLLAVDELPWGDAQLKATADLMLSWVLPALATIWFWKRFGATPGKLAGGLRIVDAAGGELANWQLVARYLGYLIAMVPLGLGLLWILVDRRGQGWHDKIARTLVVRTDD